MLLKARVTITLLGVASLPYSVNIQLPDLLNMYTLRYSPLCVICKVDLVTFNEVDILILKLTYILSYKAVKEKVNGNVFSICSLIDEMIEPFHSKYC